MEPNRIARLVGALALIALGASALAYGLYAFERPRPIFALAAIGLLLGLGWLWFDFIKPRYK